MDTFFQDIRYGLRVLLKSPGFTVVAVIALALGIGANSAIFSVVNSVLLRPLPYSDSGRLMFLEDVQETAITPVAFHEYDFWREQNKSFEYVCAFFNTDYILTGLGEPERIRAYRISASTFPTLGINPVLGRTFVPEEDQPGREPVVVLSDRFWKSNLSGDPAAIGKSLTLSGRSYTIIGILPPNPGTLLATRDLFTPLSLDGTKVTRGTHFMNVIGKLKRGVTIAQGQADLNTVAENYRKQNSTTHGISVTSLQEVIVGDSKSVILILFGAVGFVLLIACANVANLLLARAASRQKEIALRSAIGAGRTRILRQLLTESVLLSSIGGICGIALAFASLRFLVKLSPGNIPRVSEIGLDARVILFTVLLSVVTGIVFGIVPSLQASRSGLSEALKGSGRSSAAGFSGGVRGVLIVAEIALTLILLIGAGLLIKSFMRLTSLNPGFNPENVLAMSITLPQSRYGEEPQQAAFYNDVLSRTRALPGVQYAGVINNLPLGGGGTNGGFEVEGRTFPQGQEPISEKYVTSPGYFQAMGISLLKGRFFTEADAKGTLPVVIINQSLAKQIWPDEEPLGKRIKIGWLNEDWQEVVGIVNDTKHESLEAKNTMETYTPYRQASVSGLTLVVRTASVPISMVGAVKSQILAVDKDQPVYNIQTLEQVMSESLAPRRFNMFLLAIFAAIALILAAVGIYGVMAYSVNQRTQEIGIRMALGAQSADVLRLIVGQGMVLAAIGVGVGLIAALLLTRVIASLLFGVTATDLSTFSIISVILVFVAFVACYLPGRRATKVDPMVALRYE